MGEFRGAHPEIALGDITHVPRNVPSGLAFVEYSVSGGAATMVTAANLHSKEAITFDMQPLLTNPQIGTSTSGWWRAFSTVPEHRPDSVSPQQVTLKHGEVVVLEHWLLGTSASRLWQVPASLQATPKHDK